MGPTRVGGRALADYPDLEREDLLAALEFGALAAGGRHIGPLGAA